jgi:uncharacterized protein (TIGR01244 family)
LESSKHRHPLLLAWVLLLGAFLPLGSGCDASGERNFAPGPLPEAAQIEIPLAKHPFPGILSGGQPNMDQFREAKAKGYATVINLRPRTEQAGFDEAAAVRDLGMKYVSIPVAGKAGVTRENAATLAEVLSNPDSYPVLIHCKSGNRVGALFAIDAATSGNASVEEAIAIGQNAGLSSLEPLVRELLQ